MAMRCALWVLTVAAALCWSGVSLAQGPAGTGPATAPPGQSVPAAPAAPTASSPAAQATAGAPPRTAYACSLDGARLTAEQLLNQTLNWRDDLKLPPPQALPASYDKRQAGVSETVLVALGKVGLESDWARANFIGAGQSKYAVKHVDTAPPGRKPVLEWRHAEVGLWVSLRARSADAVEVLVQVPENLTGLFGEEWHLVVAVCQADTDRLLGYGIVTVPVSPFWTTVLLSLAALLLAWLALTAVAWKLNAQRLQHAWLKTVDPAAKAAEEKKLPVQVFRPRSWRGQGALSRLWWKLRRAADPVFIAQDALGCGSLSRFQLFLFSVAVATVVVYVFLRIGTLPSFSNDVLLLLGISAGSATLSRVASAGPALSVAGHRLLFGREFVKRSSSMPGYGDLVRGEGEIDVTRVQALLFTLIVVGALVANGTRDLAAFAIPEEMTFLLGLSQGIYILGKLIPSETVRRLNSQVEALLAAAAAARTSPDPAALTAFENARRAASATLDEMYGEHFDKEKFKLLQPAEAV